MKKRAPLFLAVAIGASSGLLGAWWPRSEAEPPAAAAGPSTPRPGALLAADVVAGPPFVPEAVKAPARIELALFCSKAPARGEVTVRRLEQATAARKWSGPSRPIPTDASGQAVLPLGPGIYLLTGRSAKCAAGHQPFEVKAGLEAQSVELQLEAGRAIAGTVRDASTQQPIGGALVSARQRLDLRSRHTELSAVDDAWTAVADSLGRYRLDAVGAGDFEVRASAEGFADAKATVERAPGDAKADLALEPAGFIEGEVRPLTGAGTVRDLREDGRTVFVNANGTFRLAAAPGAHVLLGEDASGATGMVRINVTPKATVRDVTLTLARAGKIHGTAALGGAPAVCARVWVRPESDPVEVASAQVSPDGTFVLDRVPAGRYWLLAECPDGEHGDVLGVEPDRPEPVAVTLKQAAGLVVRVVDATRAPVVGAEVEVSQPDREPIAAVTGADGQLELTKLVAAVVDVTASAGSRESAGQKVQLLDGQAVALELKVVDTGVIVGHIDGPAGEVVGINAFSKEAGLGNHEKVGPDGNFRVRLLPGHYKVFPWLKGYHGFDQAKEVDVAANQEVRLDFKVSRATARTLEASEPGTIGASFDDGPGGVSISWIIAGSPVDKAGLKQGDLMLAIDGKPLQRSVEAFARTKGEPGSAVRISYRRAGADAEAVVTRAGGAEL